VNFEVAKQEPLDIDLADRISKLPYAFKDPVKFDKKIDPRKLSFGSRISASKSKRNDFYKVKDVISPDMLVLDNGLKIKLLGVKARQEKKSEAIRFLRERTRDEKVFMKFDKVKYDADNNLLCYLYLRNKTFLNAHLIKNGLARADTNMDYKYKLKLLAIQPETARREIKQ